MQPFRYARPTTVEEAVRALSEGGTKAVALAGGTDLLALMKDAVLAPDRVVSLNGIAELHGVAFDRRTGLRLGALATFEDLLATPEVGRFYPALTQAAIGVTSLQIRTMGTVGGDLCQRPRCWYFRIGFGLLATRDGTSMVPEGDNRYHAILGNAGPAYYVHPSSLAPAFVALGARVGVAGPEGEREIAVEDLFRIPSKPEEKETVLGPDEIVTEIRVPPVKGGVNATYEVRQRRALDWPLAAASVALDRVGGAVRKARIVLGHVAPVPWVATGAESFVRGKRITPETAAAAGAAAVVGARPLSRNAYKVRLAQTAVKRAFLRAAGLGETS